MRTIAILIIFLSGLIFHACVTVSFHEPISYEAESVFSISYMDETIDPADDFYLFSNKAWIERNPVPERFSRFSSFEKLEEINLEKIQNILIIAGLSDLNVSKTTKKLGVFYNSGIDSSKIAKEQKKFIKTTFDQIDQYNTKEDLLNNLASFHARGIYPFFYFFPGTDAMNSKMIIAQLSQGGTGLFDKNMYLSEEQNFQIVKSEYISHISAMFELAGMKKNKAEHAAKLVFEIEKKLAIVSMTAIQQRDVKQIYNLHSQDELKQKFPDFNWNKYSATLEVSPKKINVRQPDFFNEFNTLIKNISQEELKMYYKWCILNHASEYMSGGLYEEHFSFFSRFLRGIMEAPEQDKRVISLMNQILGNAVGKLYVDAYFSPASKEKAVVMVENIRAALKERIQNLQWMTSETKSKAIEKLEAMRLKIGYPEKWRDYTDLTVLNENYIGNVYNVLAFNVKKELHRIDKPVNPNRWPVTPQTLNSYYSVSQNELIFPAAMLQPPFFDPSADDAINYGAIGAVIGHEMTHGFDEQGRKYNKEGTAQNWWTSQDEEKFLNQVEPLVTFFNNYTVLDSFTVDGRLTLSENIADLGGLAISLTAFKKINNEKKDEKIDGYTPIQRFFISYGQMWKISIREKEQIRRLREDVHSPSDARVNGVVYQLDDFYDAFKITSGKRF